MALATIIAATLVFISSIYNTYTLSKIHGLVNSNFTEAKQARLMAESALKTSQELAINLQLQLNSSKAV